MVRYSTLTDILRYKKQKKLHTTHIYSFLHSSVQIFQMLLLLWFLCVFHLCLFLHIIFVCIPKQARRGGQNSVVLSERGDRQERERKGPRHTIIVIIIKNRGEREGQRKNKQAEWCWWMVVVLLEHVAVLFVWRDKRERERKEIV